MVTKEEDEAFEQELKAAPWGYGQQRAETLEDVLVLMRQKGLEREANIIVREFSKVKR